MFGQPHGHLFFLQFVSIALQELCLRCFRLLLFSEARWPLGLLHLSFFLFVELLLFKTVLSQHSSHISALHWCCIFIACEHPYSLLIHSLSNMTEVSFDDIMSFDCFVFVEEGNSWREWYLHVSALSCSPNNFFICTYLYLFELFL